MCEQTVQTFQLTHSKSKEETMSGFRPPNFFEQIAQILLPGWVWTGTDGDDEKYGSIKGDHLSGGSGNDRLAGYSGNDKLFGDSGHNSCH